MSDTKRKGDGQLLVETIPECKNNCPASGPNPLPMLHVQNDDEIRAGEKAVERLMGNKAEARFEFIQEKAEFAAEELLDV